ncbi:hypothetical protein M422DRAFT_266697 [Sphaerobolus stellatus SS14]|uniref:Uncharacterized protein n=1 Tax=Sphaerobolus stellatus (strain SS14) TaxID=990650 RepID=A0A0C9UR00_SPHS4|nr:hypothetical protein M422DRAFT_266697 [Sphaerobolus stellatus SS14]
MEQSEYLGQPSATKSIVGWVNAYNEYLTFIFGNLGGIPADYFGPDLLNNTTAAKKIQFHAFSETEGAVAELALNINRQYTRRILLFPGELKWVETENIIIEYLCNVYRNLDADSQREVFWEEKVKDEDHYKIKKKNWDMGFPSGGEERTDMLEPFMSFEEFKFLRTQEIFYDQDLEGLFDVPTVKAAVDIAGWSWDDMKWYDICITSLYADEITEKFGNLEILDQSLVPNGMVNLLQWSRMKLGDPIISI